MVDYISAINEETIKQDDVNEFFNNCIKSIEDNNILYTEYNNKTITCMDYILSEMTGKLPRPDKSGTKKGVKIKINDHDYSIPHAVLDYYFNNTNIDKDDFHCTNIHNGNPQSCLNNFLDTIMFEKQWTRDSNTVAEMVFGKNDEKLLTKLRLDMTQPLCNDNNGNIITCFDHILEEFNQREEFGEEFRDFKLRNITALINSKFNNYNNKNCRISETDDTKINCLAKVISTESVDVSEFVDNVIENGDEVFIKNLFLNIDNKNIDFVYPIGENGEHRKKHILDWLLESYTHYFDLSKIITNLDIYTKNKYEEYGNNNCTNGIDKIINILQNNENNEDLYKEFLRFAGTTDINEYNCKNENNKSISCIQKLLNSENSIDIISGILPLDKLTENGKTKRVENGKTLLSKILKESPQSSTLYAILQNPSIDWNNAKCGTRKCIHTLTEQLIYSDNLSDDVFSKINIETLSQSCEKTNTCVDKLITRKINKIQYKDIIGIFTELKNKRGFVYNLMQNEKIYGMYCKNSNGEKIPCHQKIYDMINIIAIRALGSSNLSSDDNNIINTGILSLIELNRNLPCRVYNIDNVIDIPSNIYIMLLFNKYLTNDNMNLNSKLNFTNELVNILKMPTFEKYIDDIIINESKVNVADIIASSITPHDVSRSLNYAYDMNNVEIGANGSRSIDGRVVELYKRCKCRVKPFEGEIYEGLSKKQITKMQKQAQLNPELKKEYEIKINDDKRKKREYRQAKEKWENDQQKNIRLCLDKICFSYYNLDNQPYNGSPESWVYDFISRGDEYGTTNLPDKYDLSGVYKVNESVNFDDDDLRNYINAINESYKKVEEKLCNGIIDIGELLHNVNIKTTLAIPTDVIKELPIIHFEVSRNDELVFDEAVTFSDLIHAKQRNYIENDGVVNLSKYIKYMLQDIIRKDRVIFTDMNKTITQMKPTLKTIEHTLVISRRPYDMMRASSCQNWSSCFNIKNGSNKHMIPIIMHYDGYIVYLASDEFAPTWLARMWLLPTKQCDNEKTCFALQSVYGLKQKLVHDAVKAILYEKGYNTSLCEEETRQSHAFGFANGSHRYLVNTLQKRCSEDDLRKKSECNDTNILQLYKTHDDEIVESLLSQNGYWVDCPDSAYCNAPETVPRLTDEKINNIKDKYNIYNNEFIIKIKNLS